MSGHDIVVIGTSAGGVEALQQIFKRIPPDTPASFFVVMHVPPHVPSFLSEVLFRSGRLPAIAVHGPMTFKHGRIYVAPADHHLILDKTRVSVNKGPRENWSRPSIDVLFRSAARSHGPRVIGVVLTGFLDDGSAGLAAIKQEGGITMVQDPEDAVHSDMPRNAMETVDVDHCLPLSRIPDAILDVVAAPAEPRRAGRVTKEVDMEAELAKVQGNGRAMLDKIGEPSTFTCPECAGPLWELRDDKLTRFRCQVGHAYSAVSILTAQQDVVERALWVALGAMQSRIALWRRLADRMKSPHLQKIAQFYRSKEQQEQRDIQELREILTRNGDTKAPREGSPRRVFAASAGSEATRRPGRRTRTRGRSRRRSAREA